MDIKTNLYVPKKIFDNDLVVIHKNKVILTVNKPVYVGICILDLSKVLIYGFHYNYIKNKYGKTQNYYSQILIAIYMKLKPRTFMKILVKLKKCLILVIIQLSQNIMMNQTS